MNNILFVSHNLELEGATWSLFYLAKGFKNMGWSVSVISLQSGPLLGEYKKEDISISIGNYINSEYIFKDIGYDVIFINTIIGFKFIDKLRIDELGKAIWCIRESEREVYFKRYKDLKEEYFRKVKKVIFVSETTRDIYSDLDNGNFITIHNGLDIEKIDKFILENSREKLRRKYGLETDDIVINITGTVCLRKGQMEFVQSAVKILRDNNYSHKKLKFLIIGAGRGGSYEKIIREMIIKSGNEKNIYLIKETPDVYEYFLISDIFVCNSYIESFPRVVLEAMAFSLPIIATSVYGIPEQIENGESGLLIMAGDVNMLTEKINFVINNREKSKMFGANARKKIMTKFSYKEMLKNYSKCFEDSFK